MTEHLDHRHRWIRQRTFDLQKTGMSYEAANAQAEAEAEVEFADENGHNGNGAA